MRVERKPQPQLNEQVYQVSSLMGTDIAQPSTLHQLQGLDFAELSSRFPTRARFYEGLLQGHKNGNVDRGELAVASQRIKMMNSLDAYISHHEATPEDRILRPRQMEAVQALRDQMESGRVAYRGHFRLPTRFGKTVLFSEIIKALDVKTMVVVPTLMTGTQAEDELIERVDPEQLGRVFGGAKERSRQVTITTYQSLLADINNKRVDPFDYELLILDEAHLALSEARQKAVDKFLFALKLGFTATPKYSEEKQVRSLLYPLIYGMSTREAVEEGILAPFTAYEAYVDSGTDLKNVKVNTKGDYDEADLARAVNNDRRNRAAVEIYSKAEFFGEPAFVFCAGIDHAESMAKAFKAIGVSASVISGKNSLEEQRAIRSRFQSGEIEVLCSADILTTGINEPMARVAINARPTMSAVMAEQRGGRVLTLDPNYPEKHASIIDIVDRNSKGILYSEVVTEGAQGATIKWGVDAKPEKPRIRKAIEIVSQTLNVRTKEVLTILEDLKKASGTGEEYRQKVRIEVSMLLDLLGRGRDSIAASLPNYFKGKPARVERQIKDIVRVLREGEKPGQSIELPLNVFQEMVVDVIFQRVHSDAILQELPRISAGLRNRLNHVAKTLPDIRMRMDAYSEIASRAEKGVGSYKERDRLVDAAERSLKSFINIREGIVLQAKDKRMQQVHRDLNVTRAWLVGYRDSEDRALIRRRIRKIMTSEPALVLDFLNAKEDFKGTELFARLKDVLEPNEVKSTLDKTVSMVFTDEKLPENNFDFISELRGSLGDLSRFGIYEADLKRWLGRTDELLNNREGTAVEINDRIVAAILAFSGIVAKIATGMPMVEGAHFDTGTIEQANSLQKAINAQLNNMKILRSFTIRSLAENPNSIYPLVRGFGEISVATSDLVVNVRKNPNFITLKLRQAQRAPREERERTIANEEQISQEVENAEEMERIAAELRNALGL